MKVLWFSHISIIQDKDGKTFYPGGNWITSLKDLFKGDKDIELGIVFFGEKDDVFEDITGVKYYQLAKIQHSKLISYYKNWRHEIGNDHQVEKLLLPIYDFKPDVIHIFGTESIFGQIAEHTTVPLIIHLQGIINPCLNAWHFPDFKLTSLLKSTNLLYFLKGVGQYHDYFRLVNMAKRELKILKTCSNFMGRTHWDKSLTKLYSPNSKYYHCEEVIRDCFYNIKWEMPQSNKKIFTTTINAQIYKGLDVILKTAFLLKQNTTIDFEWHIYGIKQDSEYVHLVENIVGDHFQNNNIILKGLTLGDDLLDGLLKSNLFIHCSYIDNSPNSVCEAQLIGLPVISTNVGGISSLINDEVDGFLVPSNEPHILAFKMLDLINNPNKLLSVSEESYNVAHKRHERKKIKEDLVNIYKDIIPNRLDVKNN